MPETDAFPPGFEARLDDARTASFALAVSTTAQRNAALLAVAAHLRRSTDVVIAANAQDLENGRANGLSDGLLDRLTLDEGGIESLAGAVEQIVGLADPV